jgi:hypothetical protein
MNQVSKWVAGGIWSPAPTPPTVRVRSGRFNKFGAHDEEAVTS